MPDTPLNPDALEAAARALLAVQQPEVSADYAWNVQFDDGREELRKEAAAAVSAYLAAALPEVTSVEQWDALPIGTMVRVHFNGNSELIIRCPAGSGAGIGGMSFLGGRHWSDVFTVWNADKRAIKYIPEVKP